MRFVLALAFVALVVAAAAGLARADSSVPAAAPAPSASCSWEQTSYARAVHSDAVKQAEKIVPAGVYFMQAGRRHFLFGHSWGDRKPRTVVYSLDRERVAFDLPVAPTALVENADGSLAGVLRIDAYGVKLERADDRAAPRVKLDGSLVDSASVVLDADGCTAWIGLYHRIATGSALVSANLCTGALNWKADVLQLNVAHSKYFNDVSVERRGGEIVMRGVEAAGCYEQVFDAATGARKHASFSLPPQR